MPVEIERNGVPSQHTSTGRAKPRRLVPLIATVLLVALGLGLGHWQTSRGDEKQAIADKLAQREAAAPLTLGASLLAADQVEYRRVAVSGTFLSDWAIYLDNRPQNGVAGFYVLMPLRIADSDTYVLVARGWAPRSGADRSLLPRMSTPTGRVALTGVARLHPGRLLQLGEAAPLQPHAIVQNVDVTQLAAASHLKLQPFIIEQTSDLQDGLVRDWVQPSLGIERHRGYAFQWYALAAMAALFFVFTGFRRGKK